MMTQNKKGVRYNGRHPLKKFLRIMLKESLFQIFVKESEEASLPKDSILWL